MKRIGEILRDDTLFKVPQGVSNINVNVNSNTNIAASCMLVSYVFFRVRSVCTYMCVYVYERV